MVYSKLLNKHDADEFDERIHMFLYCIWSSDCTVLQNLFEDNFSDNSQ